MGSHHLHQQNAMLMPRRAKRHVYAYSVHCSCKRGRVCGQSFACKLSSCQHSLADARNSCQQQRAISTPQLSWRAHIFKWSTIKLVYAGVPELCVLLCVFITVAPSLLDVHNHMCRPQYCYSLPVLNHVVAWLTCHNQASRSTFAWCRKKIGSNDETSSVSMVPPMAPWKVL